MFLLPLEGPRGTRLGLYIQGPLLVVQVKIRFLSIYKMYVHLHNYLMDHAFSFLRSKQCDASSTDQFSLPKLHQPAATAPRGHSERSRTTYNFSRSELMALAKFRNPEAAEQVISWLEKGGKLNSGNYS